ncbi:MAG: hypothetical protein RM021_014435 [Nostoc sp. EkiNYC01]|nr:hypothetical protein [Nostoc sp. EkiNYC01]
MAFEPVIIKERVDDIPLVLTQQEYMRVEQLIDLLTVLQNPVRCFKPLAFTHFSKNGIIRYYFLAMAAPAEGIVKLFGLLKVHCRSSIAKTEFQTVREVPTIEKRSPFYFLPNSWTNSSCWGEFNPGAMRFCGMTPPGERSLIPASVHYKY